MPSALSLILLAAVGYGAYTVLKSKEQQVDTWEIQPEPERQLSPAVPMLPDQPPARDTREDRDVIDWMLAAHTRLSANPFIKRY